MRSTDDQEDWLQHGRFGQGEQSIASSLPIAVWRATSILGICLIVIAIAVGYVDVATHFKFEFLSHDFDILLIAALIGVVASFVGLIAWARRLEPKARVRMAVLVFVSPWSAGLAGYALPGNDVHGPGILVPLLILPASILALALLLIGRLTNSERP